MRLNISWKTALFLSLLSSLIIAFQLPLPKSMAEIKTAIAFGSDSGFLTVKDGDDFDAEKLINRAEFLKILITAKRKEPPEIPTEDCFRDVPKDSWFAPYVCHAKKYSLVKGYVDGTFRPDGPVRISEAAKLLSQVFAIAPEAQETRYSFWPFLRALGKENILPPSITNLQHPLTRGETVEILWRILEEKHDEPHKAAEDILTADCRKSPEVQPENVDMERVRSAWMSWLNGARASAGLGAYSYNDQLIRTAFIWSDQAAEQGVITHKRSGQSAYYDYNRINAWFRDLGLTFANMHGVTFTENIGWGPYRCGEEDCTDELIAAIRPTFDFYMAEKGRAYRPHYNSIMSSGFHEIGMSLAVKNNRVYITTHYATAITSNPEPICPMITV